MNPCLILGLISIYDLVAQFEGRNHRVSFHKTSSRLSVSDLYLEKTIYRATVLTIQNSAQPHETGIVDLKEQASHRSLTQLGVRN